MKTRSLPVFILTITAVSLAAILAFAQQKPDGSAQAQTKRYPLESVEGLRFHNVTAEPSLLQGKKGWGPRSLKRLSAASNVRSNMLKGWSGLRALTSRME